MSYRKKLQNKIRKGAVEMARIKSEITELEIKLREAQIRFSTLEELWRIAPEDEQGAKKTHHLKGIREGSKADKARAILMKAGRPMKINEILHEMGEPKSKRQSLGGILSMYVRKEEIFTRPEPGVFGLKEFKSEEEESESQPSHLKAVQ